LYHPCQLEARFGGNAKSPTNYWPPYVGKEFYPDGFKAEFFEESEYLHVIN